MVSSQHQASEFTLTKNQVVRLYNAPENFRDRVLIKTLYFAGMRRFEVQALQTTDINFGSRRIVVQHGKGDKMRVVPIIDMDFLSDLKHLTKGQGPSSVFQNKEGRPITPRQINNIVMMAGRRAGIQHPNPHAIHINPHLLRHSIARHLKTAGFQAEWIQKFLGHSSIRTTMDVYGTIGMDEMQAIADKKLLLIEEKPQ